MRDTKVRSKAAGLAPSRIHNGTFSAIFSSKVMVSSPDLRNNLKELPSSEAAWISQSPFYFLSQHKPVTEVISICEYFPAVSDILESQKEGERSLRPQLAASLRLQQPPYFSQEVPGQRGGTQGLGRKLIPYSTAQAIPKLLSGWRLSPSVGKPCILILLGPQKTMTQWGNFTNISCCFVLQSSVLDEKKVLWALKTLVLGKESHA